MLVVILAVMCVKGITSQDRLCKALDGRAGKCIGSPTDSRMQPSA